MGQESKWDKGYEGILLFTPERDELTLNNHKQTNGRVKICQGSKCAKTQDRLLLVTS